MSGLDQFLFFLAGWLSDHSYPVLAGFLGGIVGSEMWTRWRARKKRQDDD